MSLEESFSGYCRGLSEVALGVEDVATSVRFYEESVGLVAEVIDEKFAFLWAGEPGSQQRVVLLSRSLSPIARRPESKATRPGDPSSVVSEIGPADFGRTHFAFFVPKDDLMSAVRRLEQHSVEVYGPVEFEWMEAKSYYFLDPDENLVEFWSPSPDRLIIPPRITTTAQTS